VSATAIQRVRPRSTPALVSRLPIDPAPDRHRSIHSTRFIDRTLDRVLRRQPQLNAGVEHRTGLDTVSVD
jgi:hypothetical protein